MSFQQDLYNDQQEMYRRIHRARIHGFIIGIIIAGLIVVIVGALVGTH